MAEVPRNDIKHSYFKCVDENNMNIFLKKKMDP